MQPLKQEIYDVQAHQRKIQRDATNLKHGKPTEFSWDWPEEVTSVRRRSARRSIGRRGAAELEEAVTVEVEMVGLVAREAG